MAPAVERIDTDTRGIGTPEESVSLTAIRNTRRISVAELNASLSERGMTLSNGYGKLKEETFRIGHMGDNSLRDLDTLLGAIDEFLGVE